MAQSLNGEDTGYLSTLIKRRIKDNKNFLCCMTGETGSGKSYSAVRMGEVLDPEFGVENICFTMQEFMDLVNGRGKKLKAGSVIVWDEMQVAMSSQDFQTLQAKMLNYVLQTFRHQNFILIVTTPHFNFINSMSRRLFHARWETIGINKMKKFCLIKPLMMQTNQTTGKIYQKYPIAVIDGKQYSLKRVAIYLPSPKMLELYEFKKNKFVKELNLNIQKQMTKMDLYRDKYDVTPKQREIALAFRDGKSPQQVCDELKTGLMNIHSMIYTLRKKGIYLKPVKSEDKKTILRYEVTDIYGLLEEEA